MTKIMYEIPSDPTIQSVCITERCVRTGEAPADHPRRLEAPRSDQERRRYAVTQEPGRERTLPSCVFLFSTKGENIHE